MTEDYYDENTDLVRRECLCEDREITWCDPIEGFNCSCGMTYYMPIPDEALNKGGRRGDKTTKDRNRDK